MMPAMHDVLRLTKAGRLNEATALLQENLGGSRGRSPTHRNASSARSHSPAGTLDFVRPEKAGAAWTDSDRSATPSTRAVRGAFTWHTIANAAGSQRYKLYVPSTATERSRPLVLMLHGCTQSPDDFAAGTRMNALAEEFDLLVAYPEQNATKHGMKCWNWYKPSDQRRGEGEVSLLAAVVADVAERQGVDAGRVFVAGLSAGGAAAANAAQAYPDVFRGVGVHSGLACGAARDLPSALAAMKKGAPARYETPSSVPCIVFHGSVDPTVHPTNAQHVLAGLMADCPSSEVTRGRAAGGAAYTREVWCDRQNKPRAELWSVEGAGHAWAGGSSDGSYTDPRGPDASREMVRFFLGLGNFDGGTPNV